MSIEKEKLTIDKAIGLEKPLTILYNSNGLGYGVFPIDIKSMEMYPNLENEVMKAHSYINLYENTLLGNVPAEVAFEAIRKGINAEKNEILIRLISSEASSLFWTFLTKENRADILLGFESQLWNLLQSDLPANIKKSLFSLYSGFAYSQSGKIILYSVWHKDLAIENSKLNPD